MVGHEGGQAHLGGGVHGEYVELVHLAELGHEGGGAVAVADFPAGDVVGLAEAGDDQAAGGQLGVAGQGLVLALEADVLVHLVPQHHDVGVAGQFRQGLQVGGVEQAAGGVVGGVDDDHAGAGRDQGAHLVPVGLVVRVAEVGVDGLGAHGLDGGHVGVVHRGEDDDLVPRAGEGGDGGEQGLGGAGGDGDLALGIVGGAVEGLDLGGDGLAQFRQAGHGGVLVAPVEHGLVHGVEQAAVGLEIGETLGEIDGAAFGGQLAHHGEDGGAHPGQLGIGSEGGVGHGNSAAAGARITERRHLNTSPHPLFPAPRGCRWGCRATPTGPVGRCRKKAAGAAMAPAAWEWSSHAVAARSRCLCQRPQGPGRRSGPGPLPPAGLAPAPWAVPKPPSGPRQP